MKTFVTKFALLVILVLGIGQVASAQCQAAFTTSGSSPSFTFTNNSTPSGTGWVFAFWDFGDGNYGYNWNENHTYAVNGTYLVTLSILDSLSGCSATTVDSVLVTGATGPSCAASFSVSGSGTSYAFNNSSSPGPSIANAIWDFGDGTWGYNWNENHTYAANGTYTVSLTIVDSSSNCTDQASATVTVTGASGGGNCQAAFTTSGSGASYSFANNSTPSTGMVSAFWDFGDGNYGYSWNESHTYAVNGTYIVSLTISDSLSNCWDTAYDSVVVTGASSGGPNCQASFYHFPDSTGQYSIIAVNNSTGSNLTYAWDWGDGSSSTGAYPSHTYAGPGLYLICLTITDANGGCTSVFCDSVNVVNKVAAPFTINVVGSGATGIEEEAVAGLEFYPNPVTEKLNIEFDLDRSQLTNVLVIDLMGQVVAELHGGMLTAGHQSLQWNPENAAPGVYFLTIVTEEGKIAKKVMLAK